MNSSFSRPVIKTEKAPHPVFNEWELFFNFHTSCRDRAGALPEILFGFYQDFTFVTHVAFIIKVGMVINMRLAGGLAFSDLRNGCLVVGTAGTGSALRMFISRIWHRIIVLKGLITSVFQGGFSVVKP